ncbi:hypothetical protein FWF48_00635 [Candidatus Saccharibacteria bacterium]|nr:hypothetical protein [Candidatus Saccharibacteria bacterium]
MFNIYRLDVVEHLLADDWLVFMLVKTAIITHYAVIERVFENIAYLTLPDWFTAFRIARKPVLSHYLGNSSERFAFKSQIENLDDVIPAFRVWNYGFYFTVRARHVDIRVTYTSLAWVFAVVELLFNASLHVVADCR